MFHLVLLEWISFFSNNKNFSSEQGTTENKTFSFFYSNTSDKNDSLNDHSSKGRILLQKSTQFQTIFLNFGFWNFGSRMFVLFS